MIVDCVIPGKPQPKQRARRGAGGRWYTPQATRAFERSCAVICAWFRPSDWPLDARYSVRLVLYFADRRRRDLDNVCKSVLDGCNGVLWDDDSQVDSVDVRREYDKARPRTQITVEVLP